MTEGNLILVKPSNDAQTHCYWWAINRRIGQLQQDFASGPCVLRISYPTSQSCERCPTFYPESLGAFCLVKQGETNAKEICDYKKSSCRQASHSGEVSKERQYLNAVLNEPKEGKFSPQEVQCLLSGPVCLSTCCRPL